MGVEKWKKSAYNYIRRIVIYGTKTAKEQENTQNSVVFGAFDYSGGDMLLGMAELF